MCWGAVYVCLGCGVSGGQKGREGGGGKGVGGDGTRQGEQRMQDKKQTAPSC